MKQTICRMTITVLVSFFLLCIIAFPLGSPSRSENVDSPPDVLVSLGFGFKAIRFSIHNRNNETVELNYNITIKPVLRSSHYIEDNCSVDAESTKNVSIPISGYPLARITLCVKSLQFPDWPGPFCAGVIIMGFIIPTIHTVNT
ncbi:MAG: hypothetical protein V1726_08860 [Methanobacteriota archaeon]